MLAKAKAKRHNTDWKITPGDQVFYLPLPDKRQKDLMPRPIPILKNTSIRAAKKVTEDNKKAFVDFVNSLTREDGHIGTVQTVHRLRRTVKIQGVNVMSLPSLNGADEDVQTEIPVSYDRVFLLDPVDNLPTICDTSRDELTGHKIRTSRRSGQVIPWNSQERPKRSTHERLDTMKQTVLRRTYVEGTDFDEQGHALKKQSEFEVKRESAMRQWRRYSESDKEAQRESQILAREKEEERRAELRRVYKMNQAKRLESQTKRKSKKR